MMHENIFVFVIDNKMHGANKNMNGKLKFLKFVDAHTCVYHIMKIKCSSFLNFLFYGLLLTRGIYCVCSFWDSWEIF